MDDGGRVDTPRKAREYTPKGGGRDEEICERSRSHSSCGVLVLDAAATEASLSAEYFVQEVR